MKICMLATCHITEDARLFHKEAITLSKKHDVTIIARGNEEKEYKKQNVKHVSFGGELNAKNYFPRFFKILISAYKENPDVYHCHEPGSLLIGVLLSKINGAKVVYDVHENWPSVTMTSSFLPSFIKPLVEPYVMLLENILVPHADYVISVSKSVQYRLLAHNNNHVVVYNYPIIYADMENVSSKEFDCVYTGSVSINRGFDVLCKVAEKNKKMSINIIGESNADLPNNVIVTSWVPFKQLHTETSKSKIGLILFQPNVYNNIIGLPQKLFEYMCAGLPVVAPDFPEIRKIVNKANCGLLVDTTCPESVYNAIYKLLNDVELYDKMSKNGIEYIKTLYNWNTQEYKLLDVYSQLEK